MEAETLAAASEIDFSLLGLFLRATFTVKLVMISLIVASFWSWSIIVQKMLQYRRAKAEADAFDQAFWSGEPLDGLYDTIGSDRGRAKDICRWHDRMAQIAPRGW
jgi:biopolymer transport protein TolQ